MSEQDTARLQAEIASLKSRLRLLEQIIDHAPVPLFAKDARNDYRYIIWNKELESFFKTPSAKILGINDRELFENPEEAAYFRKYDESVMEGKNVVDIPCEEVRTAEGVKLAHTRKIPLCDEQGNPSVMLGCLVDITREKQTEGELRESKRLLEEAQRISRMGHYVYDIAQGTFTCSSALDSIFGIKADSPKTTEQWSTLMHPDDREEMKRYLADEVIGQGRVFDREYRIETAAATIFFTMDPTITLTAAPCTG
jgi:PAS domain S-box-containing protein